MLKNVLKKEGDQQEAMDQQEYAVQHRFQTGQDGALLRDGKRAESVVPYFPFLAKKERKRADGTDQFSSRGTCRRGLGDHCQYRCKKL
jgi:hypothetical protein